MKEEYKDFVGIYDDSVPLSLCKEFVENHEVAVKNRTIIDLSKKNEIGIVDVVPKFIRDDQVVYITPTASTIHPIPPVRTYFKFLEECFRCYVKNYGIEFNGKVYNDVFKIHKVKKTEGYHAWHYERSGKHVDRVMAYMTYLKVPQKGGETEFLHQSLRIDPFVGRTLIWPGGFTHMHRGNPPLEGEKIYITGWFKTDRDDE